jgi:hypothetical protein
MTTLNRRDLMSSLAISVLVPALPLTAVAESGNSGAVQEEIKGLERQRALALVHDDVTTLEALLAPEFIEVSAAGWLRTKADNIQGHKKGETHWSVFNLHDLTVEIVGETAVVRGSVTRKGTSGGRDLSGSSRYTRYYLRREGKWQAVFQYGIPEPAGTAR